MRRRSTHDELATRDVLPSRRYPKRSSRTTSCTDGASPPPPATGRRSNKDAVNARAAEHARNALHLRIKAALTLSCRMKGQAWALAPAKADRNLAVSSLHRPPTSAAETTNRARPTSPDNAGEIFLSFDVPPPRRLRHGLLHENYRRRHQRRVNRKLCPMPQSEPVSDHLQATSIQVVVGNQIHVAHRAVRGHAGSCLSAHLRSRALKWESRFPRTPATWHAARHFKLAATGKCAWTEGEDVKADCPTLWPLTSAMLSVVLTPKGLAVIGQELGHCHRDVATLSRARTFPPTCSKLSVATQSSVGSVLALPHGLEACWPTLPTVEQRVLRPSVPSDIESQTGNTRQGRQPPTV